MTSTPKIGVMGAGAIGCWLGGCLHANGADVVLVGRPRVKEELESSGMTLEEVRPGGPPISIAPGVLRVALDVSALADREVVLCCVKSGDTAAAAAQMAPVLAPGTIVVSMQNGVRNADTLRAGLPGATVLAGIFGFNVVGKGAGRYRRATSGPLAIERRDDPRAEELVRRLVASGHEVVVERDLAPLQWSKLVMNLGNAVSALTDRPTQELLFDAGYRRILAAIMQEAISVMRVAGVKTARLGPLPVQLFPWVLRLPTPLLRVVASLQVEVDPEARSSMWEDLQRRRPTEVDDLNGQIVRLAREAGAVAPLNARIITLVREAEARAEGSPKLSASALWDALTS